MPTITSGPEKVRIDNMDAVLLDFVKDNIVTIGLALSVLKVIAKATPWAVDDQIVQILTGFAGRKG